MPVDQLHDEGIDAARPGPELALGTHGQDEGGDSRRVEGRVEVHLDGMAQWSGRGFGVEAGQAPPVDGLVEADPEDRSVGVAGDSQLQSQGAVVGDPR